MRLKVLVTGKPEETKIVNAETGETVVGVAHAEIIIDPFHTEAILILQDFAAEIETDKVKIQKVTDTDIPTV
jgi:hypothetical protein